MKVSEALKSRITCRAYLDKPVSAEQIRELIEVAKYAPSGGNLQPWNVDVLTGAKLTEFLAMIAERQKTKPMGDGMEYDIYPKGLADPYRARRSKCGEDMYASIGVERDDKAGRLSHFLRNFEAFGAPVLMFFSVERYMGQPQWSDVGMFMQSIMLLAREHGLHTSAQEAWAIWPNAVREFIGMPDDRMLFCGLGLGYMDTSAAVNSLRTERAPFEEIVTLHGF